MEVLSKEQLYQLITTESEYRISKEAGILLSTYVGGSYRGYN
ncbi:MULTISPECIES: hypothetical protein [Aerococcus]|nr:MULTISPECIES: hypothetical protein [Aerococcus]MDK6369650.1 hypothetical protein [Aerococcus sp. UMB9870]MDK6680155.1 hypothetical protein [Aerococcus sp. UMB8608]MDK6686316.1 hypothetical protein [Aerococcus sp. UMB8623]MDK6940236.1 hypothetical protein [Aerococcus sp. UMB8487]